MPNTDPFVEIMKEWVGVFMHNSMHNVLRFSRESGWSMTQLGTLMIVYKRGETAVSDIGEELGITNAAASQLLERLVQEELIQRTEDPSDRRVKQIRLTEKGLHVLQESIAARQSWIGDLAAALNSDEKQEINRALSILVETAKEKMVMDIPGCIHRPNS